MRSSPSLLCTLLLLQAGVAVGQTFSEAALRKLFKVEAANFDESTETLRCTWPFERSEELRAFEIGGGPWLFDGKLRMPHRSAVTLREIAFRPPLRIELEARLTRPSSILEFHLRPTGGEPLKPIAFVNRPVRDEKGKTVRTDGLVPSVGGIRQKPLGGIPSTARHDAPFKVIVDVTDEGIGVTCDGSAPQSIAVAMPELFSLIVIANRGGVDIDSMTLTGAVPLRSLEKLLNTGKTIARDERSSGDDARVGSRGFGAEWRVLSTIRGDAWNDTLKKLERAVGKNDGPDMTKKITNEVNAARKKKKKGSAVLGTWATKHQGEDGQGELELLRGLELLRENENASAIDLLEPLVAKKRRWPDAWRVLGIAQMALDRPNQAAECFEAAYSQERSNWRNNALRGIARMKLGDFVRARTYLRAAGRVKDAPEALDELVEFVELLDKGPFGRNGHRHATDEFIIEADIGEDELERFGAMLKTFRDYMKDVLPLPVKQTRPSRVWLFESKEGYMSFTAKLTGRLDTSLGVYYPPLDTLLLFATMSTEQNLEVLFHEAFHQYLDIAVQNVPRWFNEGHAEYFGATKFDAKGAAIPAGMLDGRLTTMRVHLADGKKLVPLKDLITYGAGRFMSGTVSLHYAQSWAFVHFMRHGAPPESRALFEKYADAIMSGRREKAYEESFGTLEDEEMAALDAGLLEYVQNVMLKAGAAGKETK